MSGTPWKDRPQWQRDERNAKRRADRKLPGYLEQRHKYVARARSRMMTKRAVEVQLVRGVPISKVMTDHGITYEDVLLIRDGKMPRDGERWGPM